VLLQKMVAAAVVVAACADVLTNLTCQIYTDNNNAVCHRATHQSTASFQHILSPLS